MTSTSTTKIASVSNALPDNNEEYPKEQAYATALSLESASSSDAPVRVFSVFEATTHNAGSARDGIVTEPAVPASTFTNFGPMTPPAPQDMSSPPDITSTVPENHQLTHQGPVFDPAELRSIFPVDLPPRPAPERSLLARIFTRRPKPIENIELGPGTGGSVQETDPQTRWRSNMLKPLRKRAMVMYTCTILALLLVYLLWVVYEVVKRQNKGDHSDGIGQQSMVN